MELDLYRSALSLTIHKQGTVSEADVDDVIERYQKKHALKIRKSDYLSSLEVALQHYRSTQIGLFICREGICERHLAESDSEVAEMLESLTESFAQAGCLIETTGCHWKCESAPVLTLKIGGKQLSYANCGSLQTLRAAAESIEAHIQAEKTARDRRESK